jgi:hypothetical protein
LAARRSNRKKITKYCSMERFAPRFRRAHNPNYELRRNLQMSAMPNPTDSEFSKDSSPVKKQLVEKLAIDPVDMNPFQTERQGLGKRGPFAITRFLITFGIGVAATLAWQSYGDAVREMIVSSYPQVGWLAPQAASVAQSTADVIGSAEAAVPSSDRRQLDVTSLHFDVLRQGFDRVAASQDQMRRIVDRIVAGQEQMASEISKIQAIRQYMLSKNPEPSLPQASALVATPRPLRAGTAR